jgi:hypothetical protein
MSPKLKSIRIIKSNGASFRVNTPYLASSHKQYVPFQIKTAWRPKVKKVGVAYDTFINLA